MSWKQSAATLSLGLSGLVLGFYAGANSGFEFGSDVTFCGTAAALHSAGIVKKDQEDRLCAKAEKWPRWHPTVLARTIYLREHERPKHEPAR